MELSSIASAVSNANAAQAIPQMTPPSNPPNLGDAVDVTV